MDVFGGRALHDVDDVVDGHDALHAAFGVEHRYGVQVVLGHDLSDRFLIERVGNRDDVALHDIGHQPVARRDEQVPKRHHTAEALAVIEHVGVVDGLELFAGLPAQVADGFGHGHLGAQARETWAHQPAGRILGVRQKSAHFRARRRVEHLEQRGALLLRDLLDHVDRVVRGEQAQPQAPLAVVQSADHFGLVLGAQRQKKRVGVASGQRLKRGWPFLRLQARPVFTELFDGADDEVLSRRVHGVPLASLRPYTRSGRR